MSAPADIAREGDPVSPAPTPAAAAPVRPFYWSVRRELWENRSVYVAPAVVAAVVVFGFLVSTHKLVRNVRGLAGLDPAKSNALFAMPLAFSGFAILATGFIVGVFYCLGALHGERRDRSILFWKSLPVSDLTTVLAKFSVPTAIIPATVFAVVVAAQLIMLSWSSMVLATHGLDAATPWAHWPLVRTASMLLYGVFALAIWHAPIWAWLLLVSAWARRATFLWAVAPPFAICVFEKIAFDTAASSQLLKDRLLGGLAAAFKGAPAPHGMFDMLQVDPLGFLASPGLWGGLAFAAAALAGAVRLRRNREPI